MRLSWIITISAAIMLLSPKVLRAQELPTLLVASDDKAVLEDITPESIDKLASITKLSGDTSEIVDWVQSAVSPSVILHTMRGDLSRNDTRQIFDSISKLESNITYLLYVNSAADLSWLSMLDQPENLRLALAIRELDEISIEGVFVANGLKYDPGAMSYEYANAASLALQQLEMQPQQATTMQAWSSGRSSMFFDKGVIRSGASNEASNELIRLVRQQPVEEISLTEREGFDMVGIDFSIVETEMDAVHAATLLSNCTGGEPWLVYNANEISFMTFGVPNLAGE